MAVNEFGDTIIEQPAAQEFNEFGDPIQVIQEAPVLPQLPIAPAPITAEQQSINEFIRSREAGPISRAASSVGGLLNALIAEPVRAIGGTASQVGEVLGRTGVVPADESPIKTAILGSIPYGRAIPELAQTGAEAGARTLFGAGNFINQLVDRATTGVSEAIDNPLQAALTMNPVSRLLSAFAPGRTPSQEEIDQFLMDQRRTAAIESVLSEPLVPEVIGEANIPLAENLQTVAASVPVVPPLVRAAGRGISTGARAVASPIQTARSALQRVAPTLSERIAPVATLDDAVISTLRLGPDDIDTILPRVPTAVERTLQTTAGKVPETAQEAIAAMKQTRNRLYKERVAANKLADEQGLRVNLERSLQEAEDAINSQTNLSPARKEAMIKELRDTHSGEKTPAQGQKIQEELNDELSNAYENETIDQLSLVGKKAFRDSVASQMDDIGQAVTGRAETPYRDIGNLIEVQGRLQRSLNEIRIARAESVTGIRRTPQGVPVTRMGAASRAGKVALSPFQKTQMEKLNQNVQRIFSEQPARPPVLPLEQSAITDLRASFAPSAGAASADREAQIQALIRSYPRNIRSDPALARIVAESELGAIVP